MTYRVWDTELFRMCLVDECSTVQSFVTPILLSSAGEKLGFVGDDMQLPAVTHVRSIEGCEMARWRERGGEVVMLTVRSIVLVYLS